MSYLALARRYRPRRFEDVVGQGHVVRALSNALEHQRLHHAYLFSGTRGVGKTTLARILARCLNCETGVTPHPCGECTACRAIEAGRFVDLIEVDAASRTRVEETRDLLETVPYSPAEGRYKVYLVDEVHMLSTSSFNALLKTLEEPPEHVKFLFATTEPEKVPLTVLSRCLVFALHRLPAAEIEGALARVVEAEGLAGDAGALAAIARAARGSVRDGLSLLDQALAFGGGRLDAAEVSDMLGTADDEAVYGLLERIAANDAPGVLEQVGALGQGVADASDVLDALAEALALIARRQLVDAAPLPAAAPEERVAALARALEPEAVQLDYDIAVKAKGDLGLAPDPLTALEMAALRMLAFRPEPSGRGPSTPRTAPRRAATGRDDARATAAAPKASPEAPARPPSAGAPADSGRTGDPPAAGASGEDWETIVAALDLTGMARELAQQCALVAREENSIRLALDPRRQQLLTPRLQAAVEEALSAHLGRKLKLRIDVGEPPATTPAARQAGREAQRRARARDAIERDPNVAALREAFDAEVLPDTIRPEDDAAEGP